MKCGDSSVNGEGDIGLRLILDIYLRIAAQLPLATTFDRWLTPAGFAPAGSTEHAGADS